MVRRIIRFISGILVSALALLLFGTGAGVLFETVKYEVLPVVLHAAADRVTVLENPGEIDPSLEGEMVEITKTPVRCDALLEDGELGVRVRGAVLQRFWKQCGEKAKYCPEKVDGFSMRRDWVAPEFRMGPYRIIGEQALDLWNSTPVSFNPECIPAALEPYRVGEDACHISLPDAGMQELAYAAVPDGELRSYLGRQVGDTLVHDAEASRLVYLRQWWLLPPGKVWTHVWGSLPGLAYAYLLFLGAVWLLRRISAAIQYRVPGFCLAAVALLGLLVAEVCSAAGNRAGMSGGETTGEIIFLATLGALLILGLIRKKTTAPAP